MRTLIQSANILSVKSWCCDNHVLGDNQSKDGFFVVQDNSTIPLLSFSTSLFSSACFTRFTLSLSLFISLSVSFSLYIFLYLSLAFSLSLHLFLSLSLSIFLSAYVSNYIAIYSTDTLCLHFSILRFIAPSTVFSSPMFPYSVRNFCTKSWKKHEVALCLHIVAFKEENKLKQKSSLRKSHGLNARYLFVLFIY